MRSFAFFRLAVILAVASALTLSAVAAEAPAAPMNLLLNPSLAFHSFESSRLGTPEEFKSGSIPCWDTAAYGDAEVWRATRQSALRARFTVDNVVKLHPGKSLRQFMTLAEVGLDHGDHLSLSVFGQQSFPRSLRAAIRLMRLDSAEGEWTPADFGLDDKRAFPRQARGEMIADPAHEAVSDGQAEFEVKVENAEIIGAFTESPTKSSAQPNTIGVMVEFTNLSKDDVWLYAPCLAVGPKALRRLPALRPPPAYYVHLPRTMQKLWRGEPLHIIAMGSSIDRGSANPRMIPYDEDPDSPTFKQPLVKKIDFDGQLIGHPEWNDYIGWWQHYYMYTGRFRLMLMEKFHYPIDRLLLNVMACDGSCISESHSGLADYANLSIPPRADLNGNGNGKSWPELYPSVFARPEGPRPDLVIFGSGANEKVDGADEVAIFEGAIRWFQRHYPGTEFVFCMWQNRESYTPNTGHLMELSLRYGIPYIDFPQIVSLTTRYCNSSALVPADGHPQAAAHDLWARALERAFDAPDPIQAGIPQVQLPERLSPHTIGWEGEMTAYDAGHPRLRAGRGFILDETAINLWATTKDPLVGVRLDGVRADSSRRKPMTKRDLRNSTFAIGRLALGDRHIIEVTGDDSTLVAVDSKIALQRRWADVRSPRWKFSALPERQRFASQWGAPYGEEAAVIQSGQTATFDFIGTDLSLAYLDDPLGGEALVAVDGRESLCFLANQSFTDAAGEALYMENRKAVRGLPFGWHSVEVRAAAAPVRLLGAFTYDTRANRAQERVERGRVFPGEEVHFSAPYKARPWVVCSGGVQAELSDVTERDVRFRGTREGSYEVVGE